MKVMFIVNDLNIKEPFGPMILSAVLKDKGHKTTLGVIKKDDVEKKIRSWKPDMLAYSMMSVDMKDMQCFNNNLRKRIKIFSILGGAHATLKRNCIEELDIDAVCIGEGEEAILEVVEHFEKGRSIEDIPNVLVKSNPQLKLRKLIENLDTIPFMDRELVYVYPELSRFGIKGIWTSRGCIFPCPYCFNNRQNELFKGNGKIFRRRSIDSVIRETKELSARYRVDFIRIQDDVFLYRVDDWLKDFAERWSSEIQIPFYCLLRAELVTEEMAFYLKKAGCFSVCMSIEAADGDVRIKMMRRNVTKQQLENAFKIFKQCKINVYANTMLALPFTTLKHDIASLDFAIRVQPDMPNFSIFMPYTGTDLGDYCSQVGIYSAQDDFIDYGMRNMSPLLCFSKKEKEAQYNLCELAIIAIKFPRLRNIIVNYLIYWRPNKIFFLIHYIFAVTEYGRKIFYFRHTLREYFELITITLKHFLYDYTKKQDKDTSNYVPITEEERILELNKCIDAMATYSIKG